MVFPEATAGDKENTQYQIDFTAAYLLSLGNKLEEALTRDCDFACYAAPTNCVELTAEVGTGGCA
jgi:hypothetical protein